MHSVSRRLTVIETLSASFSLLRLTLLPYLGIVGALIAGALVIGLAASSVMSDHAEARGVVFAVLFASSVPLVSLGGARIAAEARDGGHPRVWSALRDAFRLSGAWVITHLMLFVALSCLWSAFVVPGLYFGICWALTSVAMANDGLSYFAAIKRSHALVRGNWWHTAIVLIVPQVLVIVPALVMMAFRREASEYALFVLTFQGVAGAFSATVSAVLYDDLRRRHAQEPDAAQTPNEPSVYLNASPLHP